jgi:hypothetical protein
VPTDLTFAHVDDLAFAAGRNISGGEAQAVLAAADIGPLIELSLLAAAGQHSIASIPPLAQIERLIARSPVYQPVALSPGASLLRTPSSIPVDLAPWTAFGLAAQRAAESVGFPHQTAAQLVGAIKEMHDNIFDHSENPTSGMVAYRATPRRFEFVVADRGIGEGDRGRE